MKKYAVFGLKNLVVILSASMFNIIKLYILPTRCIHVFLYASQNKPRAHQGEGAACLQPPPPQTPKTEIERTQTL
jgi:hypothetical protein